MSPNHIHGYPCPVWQGVPPFSYFEVRGSPESRGIDYHVEFLIVGYGIHPSIVPVMTNDGLHPLRAVIMLPDRAFLGEVFPHVAIRDEESTDEHSEEGEEPDFDPVVHFLLIPEIGALKIRIFQRGDQSLGRFDLPLLLTLPPVVQIAE